MMNWCLTLILFSCLASCVLGDDNNHQYTPEEIVVLWVNTVGPYHNPQETYPYYQLPFCKPSHGIETHKRPSGIGEILEGNDLRNSGLRLHYSTNIEREDVCDMVLDASSVAEFELAVDRQYWYELFLDDLPMWGMVGETLRDEQHGRMEKHIFTHRSLSLAYNGDRIVEANLTSENPVPIEIGRKLEFTYSVHWIPSHKPFETRFNRYLEYDFFEHRIHWFSVFNSFMMVIFLCGLVALILFRTLKNDFARYSKEDELDVEGIAGKGGVGGMEDSGWKQVHGDVFRAPPSLPLFAALIGSGWQLLVLVVGVILFAMAGPFLHGNMYEDRGELVSAALVCFALSSLVAGYTSGAYYKQFFPTPRQDAQSNWQFTMILTFLAFPSVCFSVLIFLNVISFHNETLHPLPLSALFKLLAIWLFISLPLCLTGTILGRHWGGKGEFPCRVNSIPRPIPLPTWFSSLPFLCLATGLLPFGSIFIEMYFLFTALWSYKFYYVYGFMLLVYVILVLVTLCTTIVAVYFVLNNEDHRWAWFSFLSAGTTSVYVFFYSIFFFYFKTQMNGFHQVAHYFGNMFLFCLSLFLMCGAVGHAGASLFVRRIYQNVKID